ncbi:MAG: type 4 pilus major pilin [Pseudomonadota bacterium]|nr:type 4 pilus major pilin [Pseudomonadota bacterium]
MKRYCGSEQSGRSMVEMLGVLAIIGVLSVGGIAGYSKAMAKYKVNQTLDQIATLVVNIRTVFANQTNFSDASTANIINLGLVSADMMKSTSQEGGGSTTSLVNLFGGGIDVAPSTDNSSFELKYSGLDASACQTIALADWGAAASSGLVSIQIEGTTFKWTDNSLPITIGKAATACKGGNASITWTYR